MFKNKKQILIISAILIGVLGILVGGYFITQTTIFRPQAKWITQNDVSFNCKNCSAYGWDSKKGYTKIPTSCFAVLYKCTKDQAKNAVRFGCQRQYSEYSELHNKSGKEAGAQKYSRVVGGTSSNGRFLKTFGFDGNYCGIQQIDVSCGGSSKAFHSKADFRSSVCGAQVVPPSPTKTPTPTPIATNTPTPQPTEIAQAPTSTPTPTEAIEEVEEELPTETPTNTPTTIPDVTSIPQAGSQLALWFMGLGGVILAIMIYVL